MPWTLDPMVLMWIQVATGFMGALTFIFVVRMVGRLLGFGFDLKAYFGPAGGARDALLRTLNKARREVLVQVYSFEDEALLAALVEAKKRGCNVEVILDPHHEKISTPDYKYLLEQGIDPWLDVEARANPQVILIDGKVLITGSYDFSAQAESEYAQNLLMLRGDPDLAREFRDEFFKHKAHARESRRKDEEKPRIAA